MHGDLVERLNSLASQMNKIERRLKGAEILREEVVIAGINELRYVGRRFVDAWALAAKAQVTDEDRKEIDRHFTIAEQYLENADHDVTDAICYFVHDEMNLYIKKYGVGEIEKVSPQFVAFMKKMSEMNNIVAGSRETRHERKAAYDLIEESYIPELLDRYELIKFSESLVLAAGRRRRFLSGVYGFLIALTVIFGVITGAVTLLGWDGVIKLPWVSSAAAPTSQAASSSQSKTSSENLDSK